MTTTGESRTSGPRTAWAAVLFWGVASAFLWWVAAGPSPSSWWVGIPTVCAAAVTAVVLGARAPRLRWAALPSFLVFVLARSLAGSADVALRALRPKLAIAPAIFDYPLRSDRGRVFLSTLVSLLPGTLAARLEDGRMVVHSLSPEDEARQEILTLEGRIARLLAVDHGAQNHD